MPLISFFFSSFVWLLSITYKSSSHPLFPLPSSPSSTSSHHCSSSYSLLLLLLRFSSGFISLLTLLSLSLSLSLSPHLPPTIWALSRATISLCVCGVVCVCVHVCESHRCCIAGLSSQGRLTAGAREHGEELWGARCSCPVCVCMCVLTVHIWYVWLLEVARVQIFESKLMRKFKIIVFWT